MPRSQSVNSFDNDEDLANVEDNIFETLVSSEGVGCGCVGVLVGVDRVGLDCCNPTAW